MKKFIIFTLLVVLAFAVYGQERPHAPMSQYVDEMTGHDWRAMSFSQQTSIVQGFFLAYSAVWDVFIHNISDGAGYNALTEEQQVWLDDLFYIPVGVSVAIQRIDRYYAESHRRAHLLRETLLWATDKEWW